ncbi:MAG TPA: SRPBCC domain-containing protein [Hyphomonadaceae bacterium]|nr:SRPBCC domain-containing protein [Hyphomonadaceae bacterium]
MRTIACLTFLALSLPAYADVVDRQPAGFAISQSAHIAATPDKVYAALIQPAKWWNPAHTFSRNAAHLSLEAKAGGCFCESLAGGGSVQHGVVTYVAPGAALRLRGPLGPLEAEGMEGVLTFTLKADGAGTRITVEDSVGGYAKSGLGQWPDLTDQVLAEQVTRLQALLETGSPEPHKS